MFLNLPLELRNEVYGYAALLHEPFDPYRGLYFSCRRVKEEMDKECTRVVRQENKAQGRLSEGSGIILSFDDTDGVAAGRSLKVSVSTLVYLHGHVPSKERLAFTPPSTLINPITEECLRLEEDYLRRLEEKYHRYLQTKPILSLLSQFYFESVAIVVYEDDAWKHYDRWALEGLMSTVREKGLRDSSARRISIELPPFYGRSALSWYLKVESSKHDDRVRSNGWTKCEWVWRYDGGIQVEWEWEKSSRASAVEIDAAVVLRALEGDISRVP